MISLLMLMVLALVVGRVAGAVLGIGPRSHYHRRQWARLHGRPLPDEAAPPLPPAPVQAPVTETPLERLQARFARGDISVDEYERELNRMYGIRG
jgi:hypothetical protein